jgi:hypothetical protein
VNQELQTRADLRNCELMREMERLRGIKGELRSGVTRLRNQEVEQQLVFAERLRDIEVKVRGESKLVHAQTINLIGQSVADEEKLGEFMAKKLASQENDILGKKLKYYEQVAHLEDQLRELDSSISERRLELARRQTDNEQVGSALRVKLDSQCKLEADLDDLAKAFDRTCELERARRSQVGEDLTRLKAIKYSQIELARACRRTSTGR